MNISHILRRPFVAAQIDCMTSSIARFCAGLMAMVNACVTARHAFCELDTNSTEDLKIATSASWKLQGGTALVGRLSCNVW